MRMVPITISRRDEVVHYVKSKSVCQFYEKLIAGPLAERAAKLLAKIMFFIPPRIGAGSAIYQI
jgi:hypothetical protein